MNSFAYGGGFGDPFSSMNFGYGYPGGGYGGGLSYTYDPSPHGPPACDEKVPNPEPKKACVPPKAYAGKPGTPFHGPPDMRMGFAGMAPGSCPPPYMGMNVGMGNGLDMGMSFGVGMPPAMYPMTRAPRCPCGACRPLSATEQARRCRVRRHDHPRTDHVAAAAPAVPLSANYLWNDKHFHMYMPAYNNNTGTSYVDEAFFAGGPRGAFYREHYVCDADVTLRSLIKRLGGNPKMGDYLVEAVEVGSGRFARGQDVKAEGSHAMTMVRKLGWGGDRGSAQDPVWLVLVKGGKWPKDTGPGKETGQAEKKKNHKKDDEKERGERGEEKKTRFVEASGSVSVSVNDGTSTSSTPPQKQRKRRRSAAR